MKKVFMPLVFVTAVCLLFAGCSSDKEELITENNDSSREIKSNITDVDFSAFSILSYNAFGPHRVSGPMTFTEEDAKLLLEPFVEDGQNIKSQLISDIQNYPADYTEDDIAAVMNTTEADMAVVSFVLYQLQTSQSGTIPPGLIDLITGTNNLQQTTDFTPDYDVDVDNLQIPLEKVLGCVGEVMGFGSNGYTKIKDGIKGLMNAKTIIHIVRSTAIRYLGYVSAAIAVCDFLDCMGWTDLRIKERFIEAVGAFGGKRNVYIGNIYGEK